MTRSGEELIVMALIVLHVGAMIYGIIYDLTTTASKPTDSRPEP